MQKNKTIQGLWLRPRPDGISDDEDDGIDFDESRNDINAYLQRNRDLREETHEEALVFLHRYRSIVSQEPSNLSSGSTVASDLSTSRQAALASLTQHLLADSPPSILTARQRTLMLEWVLAEEKSDVNEKGGSEREWLEKVDCWRWEEKVGRV